MTFCVLIKVYCVLFGPAVFVGRAYHSRHCRTGVVFLRYLFFVVSDMQNGFKYQMVLLIVVCMVLGSDQPSEFNRRQN